MRPVTLFMLIALAVATPALSLPHSRGESSGRRQPQFSSNEPTLSAREMEATQLEQRAGKPSLKLVTKSPCESGQYKAVPNVSALDCARRMPVAFLKGNKCYIAAETNLAAMGPTDMGTCFVYSG